MTDNQTLTASARCHADLKAIQEEPGYSIFKDQATAIVRERLQVDRASREPRERFKPQLYKRLYHRQRGICPLCGLGMILPLTFPGGLEIDHINPNAEDFNGISNLQVTHEICNRKKGAKSIQEQSKASGKPFTEILRVPVDEEGEPIESKPEPMFLRKKMD
jgi:hypothetical protein